MSIQRFSYKRLKSDKQDGFTIVELLIVIVVIAILAAITVVAYNGIQTRARNTKIKSDMTTLSRAIVAARTKEGKILKQITAEDETGSYCRAADPLTQNKQTADCWVKYKATLAAIETASNIKINGDTFVDPYGRPYAIDENEVQTACSPDSIAMLAYPYQSGYNDTNFISIQSSGMCLNI